MLCEEVERLKVVFRELVKNLLHFQHAFLWVLDTIRGDDHVVLVWRETRGVYMSTRRRFLERRRGMKNVVCLLNLAEKKRYITLE